MRRWFVSGKDAPGRFWEVRLDGANVLTTFGKIGRLGQTRQKDTADQTAALREAERMIKRKLAEGFAEKLPERTWATSTDPSAMLDLLVGVPCARKARLYACACVSRVAHLLVDADIRKMHETTELYLAGKATAEQWQAARQTAGPKCYDRSLPCEGGLRQAAWAAVHVAVYDEGYEPKGAAYAAHHAPDTQAAKVAVVCDVFGNPFRPISLAPWRTAQTEALARATFDETVPPRNELDSARIAVLADALEEAGCTGEPLAHLRASGPHVRGCWVVDSLLGHEIPRPTPWPGIADS